MRGQDGKIAEEKNWEAELTVQELRGIATRFIDLLLGSSSTHNPAATGRRDKAAPRR
jgi:hypothetical protein